MAAHHAVLLGAVGCAAAAGVVYRRQAEWRTWLGGPAGRME